MKIKLNCLKCDEVFFSENKKTNRLCLKCNKENNRMKDFFYPTGRSGKYRTQKSSLI